MVYLRNVTPEDLQQARECLECLANILAGPKDSEALATIIQHLQDNHEATAFLLERMLHQDSRYLHCD